MKSLTKLTAFTTVLALLCMFVSFGLTMAYSPEVQAIDLEYPKDMFKKTSRDEAGSVFGAIITFIKWVGIGLGSVSLIGSLIALAPVFDAADKAKKGIRASIGVIILCILFDWGMSRLIGFFA